MFKRHTFLRLRLSPLFIDHHYNKNGGITCKSPIQDGYEREAGGGVLAGMCEGGGVIFGLILFLSLYVPFEPEKREKEWKNYLFYVKRSSFYCFKTKNITFLNEQNGINVKKMHENAGLL